MNESGEIVFVYQRYASETTTTQWDVCATVFSFDDPAPFPAPVVPEFVIHPAVGSEMADMVPAVDINAGGTFLVAWERWTSGDDYGAATAGAGLGIEAVLFPSGASSAAEGTAVETFFRDDENPSTVSVALADDGRFVIAWGSGATFEDDVSAQKYGASGTPLGSNPW